MGGRRVTVASAGGAGESSGAALDRLFAEFARTDAPGLIVGIGCGDGLSYRLGFGLASVQHRIANTPQTRVRIASITKQFTCVTIMLLAEDGVVEVDAPIATYLPDLPEPLGRATLHQLMTHSSGWRCTLEMGTVANGFAIQPPGWQARAVRRQRDIQFEPGTGQLYCNGSYDALTEVIERCSGQPLADVLRTRIFEPLAMYDTALVEDDTAMVPGLAAPHVAAGGGWRRPPADAPLRGDGGIVSTIDDMLRWLAHLRGPKRIGSKASWRQLLAPFRLADGFETTYAMGFKRHRYRGTELIQHSGGLFGLNAQVVTVPAHGIDIAIFVNGAPASATRLAFAVLDLLLGNKLTAPAPERAETARFRELIEGHFALPDGLLLGFADLGGTLAISQMAMAPVPMLYEDASSLFATFEEIGFGPMRWSKADLAAFRRDPSAGLAVTIAGRAQRLEYLPPAAEPRAVLSRGAGRYHSEALAADATVAIEGDAVVLRIRGDYSGERAFDVHVLTERHLALVSHDGEERYALELEPDREGRSAGFWIDTHRARRNRFDRMAGGWP